MSYIKRNEGSPTDTLMEALQDIEGAQRVVILIESPECLTVKTNCTHKEIKWLLDQGSYCVMKDLFTPIGDK